MNNTPAETFAYDVTEGGVLIKYGDEDGIDLTSPSDNPMVQLANIARVTTLMEAPKEHAEEILAGLVEHKPGLLNEIIRHRFAILDLLAELAAEIGQPCAVCNGDGGQEIGYGPIRWADCGACSGTRVQAAA
jgi:hypothetical protein